MKSRIALSICFVLGGLTTVSADSSATAWLRDSIPSTWQYEQQNFQTTPCDDRWWDSFHDDTLIALIKEAVQNNYNVLAAMKRIEAARQVQRQTKAGYYPTVNVAAGWQRDVTAGTVHSEHAHPSAMNYFNLGLSANWEIDVFGRIRAQLKADKASYDASVAEYDAVLVSLCANLAKAYFSLRMYQEQYDVTQANIQVADEQFKLAQARFDAGLRPYLDVVQGRMSVISTKATLPPIQAAINTSLNEIAILCGVYPEKVKYLLEYQKLPDTPQPGAIGNPESLIRRRPDVVAAEKQVAQMAALVGVAKKDFLPTLSLTASGGTEGMHLNQMFGDNSFSYSIAPQLTWTVFDGMARNARIAQARANMEAEIDSYNLTVMGAVQEVDNALVSWKSVNEQYIYQQMLLKEAKKQLELQIERYTQGLNAMSDVTGAQTTVLTYANQLIGLHGSQLDALVTLYSALGGGY